MTDIANGPYLYFTPGIQEPHIVEVDGSRVYFTGDDQPMRLDKMSGRFRKLCECPDTPGDAGENEQNQV